MWIHQTNGVTDSCCSFPAEPNDGTWLEVPSDDPRCAVVQIEPIKIKAQLALDASDKVATRCIKAGVAYPTAWHTRDIALRAIVSGADTTSTTIPPIPTNPDGSVAYPQGT